MEAPNIARIDVEPVWIGTIPVHPVRLSDTLAFIDRVAASKAGEKAVIHYANAHAVNLAGRNGSFRDAMIGASLVFCDGKSLQWAARVLGGQLPERFTPPDWIDDLCAQTVAMGHRLFFLGGARGVAKAAADELQARHPGLEVSAAHGYFPRTAAAVSEVIRKINENRTDVLLVGLGMPEQEIWLDEHLDRLDCRVCLTVGGMFDFVSGQKPRGPRWLTSIGLEWLTRLVHEPRRLGTRYVLGNPRFVWTVARQALRAGPVASHSRDSA